MTKANQKVFSLDNGMKFIYRRNSINPTVSLTLRTSLGSDIETSQNSGLTGIAASLITKGTGSTSAAEMAEMIDSLGMDIGFSAGKHTSTLSAQVLADLLPQALKIITEILSDPQPSDEELERMKKRVSTGLMMKMDDPAAVATDRLMTMIFGEKHPYGQSMQVALQSLPNLKIEDVREVYQKRILPGSFIGVITGDIDLDNIEKLLQNTLGKWQGGGEFSVGAPTGVDPQKSPLTETIEMPGKTQSDVALGFPGIKRTDPDYYALLAGNMVLGRLSLGGRIGRRIRDTEGMAYYVYTDFQAGFGVGPYVFRAGVNPKNIDRCVELALEEMRAAKLKGITQSELNDAVIYIAGSMSRQTETNSGMASMLMTQELFNLGADYHKRFPEIMRTLTLEQVNAALNRLLLPENYCLAVAGPKE